MTDAEGGTLQPTPEMSPRILVLLVDDQRFVHLVVSRLLASEPDIQLHGCEDATAAIGEANLVKPAVILQDLVLPGIDGLTLVRLFRSNPATAATPIIVLSGNDDPESRAQASAAGADDYMVKLPAKNDLVARIRVHAGRATTEPRLA
jgi:PleD family two-component response regulator